jgi:AraC-like DNA-binding protein
MSETASVLLPHHRATTVRSHLAAIEAVIAAMRSRPEAPLDLAEMAELAGLSRFHLDRVFREITGISPRKFQTSLRLNRAMRLLLTSDRDVTDVCFDVGYESLGSFVTRFTNSFGLSPQRLRSLSEQLNQPWGDWLNESALSQLFEHSPEPLSIRGKVISPAAFFGLIFTGIFPARIPLGPPVACSVTRQAGPFAIGAVPPGVGHLLAVGIPWSERPLDFLINEQTMRGALEQPIDPATMKDEVEITLRPPQPLDPPINIALPFLIVLRLLKLSEVPLRVSIVQLHSQMREGKRTIRDVR